MKWFNNWMDRKIDNALTADYIKAGTEVINASAAVHRRIDALETNLHHASRLKEANTDLVRALTVAHHELEDKHNQLQADFDQHRRGTREALQLLTQITGEQNEIKKHEHRPITDPRHNHSDDSLCYFGMPNIPNNGRTKGGGD